MFMKIRATLIVLLALCLCFSTVNAQKRSKKDKTKTEKVSKKKSSKKTSKKDKKKASASKAKKNASNSSFGVATPKDVFEFGVHGGMMFVTGDVSPEMNFGGGFHIRKSLDYIFSLRADFLYGQATGKDEVNFRDYTNNWTAGTALGILSLNAVRFDKDVRRLNYYVLAGGGVNFFETNYKVDERDPGQFGTIENEMATHATLGAGLAIRLGPRFNISIEHQASSVFGRRADLLDGYEKQQEVRTPFRDFLNYTQLGINFNIGDLKKKSEPLYWINPMRGIVQRLDDMQGNQEKQQLEIKDSDGDGVLDLIDQEPNTPPNVPVDTKGRILDSDRDGVPDHKDMEPYNSLRPGETVNSQGIVENRVAPGSDMTEDRVREIVRDELVVQGINGTNSVAEWFLPMIHFPTDSYIIKYSDYGTLAGIAKMMKGNAKLRLVVKGYTDETGPENYNQNLSYDRAREVIDHLVNNHGIGRGRLVLQWGGQGDSLVPSVSSFVNRRVEFKVASDEVEMDAPEGYELKSSSGY